jgi:hypothetical protein
VFKKFIGVEYPDAKFLENKDGWYSVDGRLKERCVMELGQVNRPSENYSSCKNSPMSRDHGKAVWMTVAKSIEAAGDNIETGERKKIRSAMADLERAVDDGDLENITAKTDALLDVSRNLLMLVDELRGVGWR